MIIKLLKASGFSFIKINISLRLQTNALKWNTITFNGTAVLKLLMYRIFSHLTSSHYNNKVTCMKILGGILQGPCWSTIAQQTKNIVILTLYS